MIQRCKDFALIWLCDLARHPSSDSPSLLTSDGQSSPNILTRPDTKAQRFPDVSYWCSTSGSDYVKDLGRALFLVGWIHCTCCSEAQWLKDQRMFFWCQGKDEYYSCPKKSTIPSFHGQWVPKCACAFIFTGPSRKRSPEDGRCSSEQGWEEGQKGALGVQKVKRVSQGSKLKTKAPKCCFSSGQNILCYMLLCHSSQGRQIK